MQIPTKRTNGTNTFEMPVFGLGTWQMGGRFTADYTNDQVDIAAIKQAIELGISHIDTAEAYGDGHCEELVGKAAQGYNRNSLFVVTKVKKENLGYKNLLASAEKSLARLQTSYIDLYMIHGPSETIPIQETMQAMDKLVAKGYVKNIAVSNFSIERLEQAQIATHNQIVAGQYHLNLQYREAERKGVLRYFQEHDKMLIAWRPLQKGLLLQVNSTVFTDLCAKYQKTPAQIAINWLISQRNIVTLSKSSSPAHLKENLGAVGWEMEATDIARLSREFPNQQDVSDAVAIR